MKKINLWLRTIAFSLIFLGTLSSSAISGSVGNAIQGDDGTLLNGKFQLSDNIPLDVPLVGIKYVARNQSGITNTEGVFVYSPGSTVQFSIGDILLGQAEAKPSITIIDIVQNGTNSSNAIAENITNFLLTLDDDGNPVNGITITEVVRALASSRSILFNQEQSTFLYDGNTQMIVSELTAATTAGPRTLYPHRSLLDALTANLAKIEPVPPPIGDTALPSARSFQRSDTEQLSTAQQSEDVVSLSIHKDCHLYDYGDDFPTNFAVPWNLFSAQHETIVKATCKQQSVLFDVAIGSESLLYIWKKAYFTKDRETWQGPVDLKGSRESETGKWWVGNASIEIPYTQEEQQKGNFFSVFLCFRVNNEWRCGCKNERCNEEAWSLQAVKRVEDGSIDYTWDSGAIVGQIEANTKTFNRNVARYLAFLSQAAYCSYPGRDPATIFKNANFSRIHFEGALGTSLTRLQFDVLMILQSDPATGREIVTFSFEGTNPKQLSDWAIDINVGTDSFLETPVEVHAGFNRLFEIFKAATEGIIVEPWASNEKIFLQAYLNQVRSGVRKPVIHLTGHSLGGAIATLFGAYLVETGIPPESVVVYTYAAPSVGKAGFAKRFQDKALIVNRYVNKKDWVPYSTSNCFSFERFGTEHVFKSSHSGPTFDGDGGRCIPFKDINIVNPEDDGFWDWRTHDMWKTYAKSKDLNLPNRLDWADCN